MAETKPQTNVATGEFPYPLREGPKESRYLTWVRNHSNYMAERGFLDYLRLGGVLVRGILINFVVLLPYLLAASLLLGLTYNTLLDDWEGAKGFFITKEVTKDGWAKGLQDLMGSLDASDKARDVAPDRVVDESASVAPGVATDRAVDESARVTTPFLVSPIVLALAALCVLLFPIGARLSKIVSYKKTLETGSPSSVKTRDLSERLFGGLLLALVGVVLIETLPLVVHYFHVFREGGRELALPTVAGAVGVLIVANKVLPHLRGLMRKLAIMFVGALGLLVPFLVVLLVVDFVVYGGPSGDLLDLALLLLPALVALAIVGAMIVGRGSFKAGGFGRLVLLLVGVVVLFLVVLVLFVVSKVWPEYGNFVYVFAWTTELATFCWLAVDVNLTSINGLYRDRLASAFLVGVDTSGDVDIEEDVDLQEIARYEAGSTAPYHLVNVALNLQGSKDMAIRERNSDFFMFSKRFIGGDRTGYCTTECMEQVYPQIDLGTAMATSAAAASPNMGRGTNPLFVAFLTLLNVRLGFWMPHPGLLQENLAGKSLRQIRKEWKERKRAPGFTFEEVFKAELADITRRWENVYRDRPPERRLHPSNDAPATSPTTKHGLVGIGFSGGGIRSATINLGIAQELHRRGVFDHIDYMSTVSGGGYLGSSLSTLMRYKTNPVSEIAGTVSVETTSEGQVVTVTGPDPEDEGSRPKDVTRVYRYEGYAKLDERITNGATVEAGQRLLCRECDMAGTTLMKMFDWRVRPGALVREMRSKLDETHKWVNLSDGGHIENLAGIELLRRRCKFIIIGDGEADANLWFNGLAALIRYARIDLGIKIDINPDAIRVDKSPAAIEKGVANLSERHWAIGTIKYPNDQDLGYLLYLKSSFTGDEDEVIEEYRHRNPDFPHESTADQFFDEGQFEAYRALGEHIANVTLEEARAVPSDDGKLSFSALIKCFEALRAGAPGPDDDGSEA